MTAQSSFRLGIDIGGTFTDFVLVDERDGRVFVHKVLTTSRDPTQGVMQGLRDLLQEVDAGGDRIAITIHATTLITNALVERKGAVTALLTTEGFRDVLEMGTEVRYDIYDLFLERPEPLVPRRFRFDVRERLDKDGNALIPLDEAQLQGVCERLREAKVEAVAICFLHSFRNSAHEHRAAELVKQALDGVSVSVSSAVAPEIREYERMSTTVANAYVQPITRSYIGDLDRRLREVGYRRRVFYMLSSGGITTAETATEFPIRMVESGPAAGVLAGAFFCRTMGWDSVISFDMGGTTAKIGLVKQNRPAKTNLMEVGRVKRFQRGSGIPLKVPVIELIEIGAGGGSIARVDSLGLLKVGPESAGADPGPACYGRGGEEPTVTDANVVLGYLDPDYFLGGAIKLDMGASRRTIESRLARPLGLSLQEAARGIFEVVNENMLSAMKVHVAERGEDPRKFYLFAFGGAGPAHAYELARALRMRGVIVPPRAGVTSALGLVTTPISFDFARSLVTRLDRMEWAMLREVFEAMSREGRAMLAQAGVAPDGPGVQLVCSLDLRHKGQGHELTVEIPDEIFQLGSVEGIVALFYDKYAEKYGHAHRDLPVELITCRLSIAGPAPEVPLYLTQKAASDPAQARKGKRRVYFPEIGSYVEADVYDRYRLAPGASFPGPAVIEERECTVVVGPSGRVRIDGFGNLFLDLQQREKPAPAEQNRVAGMGGPF